MDLFHRMKSPSEQNPSKQRFTISLGCKAPRGNNPMTLVPTPLTMIDGGGDIDIPTALALQRHGSFIMYHAPL